MMGSHPLVRLPVGDLMSENREDLPPAAGTDDPRPDEPVTVFPVSFDKDFSFKNAGSEGDDSDLYDFRPIPVEVNEIDPKGSSVLEPAVSSKSTTTPVTGSSASPKTPAAVEKVSTPPKGSKSGAQTSSSPTSTGSNEPTVEKG
jgi:hypothetical protein